MQKRISSDLVQLGKKMQPFKKNTPPLNLILWFPVMTSCPPHVHHMLWKCVKEHILLHILSSVVCAQVSSVFSLRISNHYTCCGSVYSTLTSLQTLWTTVSSSSFRHSFRRPLTLTHSCRILPFDSANLTCVAKSPC